PAARPQVYYRATTAKENRVLTKEKSRVPDLHRGGLDDPQGESRLARHGPSKPWSDKDSGLASIKSGLVALRDFAAPYDRSGSRVPITASQHCSPLRLDERTRH